MVPQIISHSYKCWLNNRLLRQNLIIIVKNLIPLILWLLLFNTINLIPKKFKPQINVRIIMTLDEYVFESFEGGLMTVMCLILLSVILHQKFFKKKRDEDLESNKFNDYDYDLWEQIPLYLLMTSWLTLNIISYFQIPVNKVKNIIALIFYVIGHVLIVPFSAWYFYLFQPPRVLKLFVIVIGIQNILVNMTHLIFPNVPPIYIQYYGENKNPTYDLPGYSEGLTRIDLNFKINKVLNFFIIYVKSIEFGILPSLHSSMSLTIVYFMLTIVKNWFIKLGLIIYCFLQIWSLIYLGHHWRIDIMFSFMYSTMIYLVVKDKLVHIRNLFKYDVKFNKLSTMGMRLFRGTRFEWLFDTTR